jgi:hypothetical protein
MSIAIRFAFASALVALCAASPISTLAQQSPSLEGARYVYREDYSDGDYQLIFIQVKGNTVFVTTQVRQSGSTQSLPPDKYPIKNNTYYVPLATVLCLERYSTNDCGRLGAITSEAINFSLVVNGRPSDQPPPGRMRIAKRQH